MKKLKFVFLFATLLFTASLISSCGNNSSNSAKTEKQGKEYTSAYICPMHCEGSGSDEAGKCPVCGMDYVKNENHKADGDQHDNDEGHNH